MLKTADGIRHIAAFDAEDDVVRAFLDDLDHTLPIHHAVAAGAAHRRAGDLAALCAALLRS